MARYSFDLVRSHTAAIRAEAASLIGQHRQGLESAVAAFDEFFASLDNEPISLARNVRKLLATTFFNHWYAALLLCEAGLTVDMIVCERSALEALAFHWLVCLEPAAAQEYEGENSPKPVVVRRRLEALGADISHLRDSYSFGSEVGHVGRRSERFHLDWDDPDKGTLFIGGRFVRGDVEHWLQYLSVLPHIFRAPLRVPT